MVPPSSRDHPQSTAPVGDQFTHYRKHSRPPANQGAFPTTQTLPSQFSNLYSRSQASSFSVYVHPFTTSRLEGIRPTGHTRLIQLATVYYIDRRRGSVGPIALRLPPCLSFLSPGIACEDLLLSTTRPLVGFSLVIITLSSVRPGRLTVCRPYTRPQDLFILPEKTISIRSDPAWLLRAVGPGKL